MAPELDVGMGMGMGTGMGFAIEAFSFTSPPSPSAAATAINGGAPNNNAYLYGIPSSSTADVMHVDDLLDLSGQPAVFDATPTAAVAANPQPYQQQHLLLPEPPVAAELSSPLPLDLRIPGEEEEAELEWLSRFLEESFSGMPFPSNGMMTNAGLLSNNNSGNTNNMNSMIHYNVQHNNYQAVDPSAAAVPGRPRTKRSRPPVAGRNVPAVSAAWSALPPSPSCSSSSSSDTRPRVGRKDKDAPENGGGSVRKCTHCASEKTPQWRTGPLGPKTLCNACGVRFKSGRLVPEYRPAASPTFVLTQHSNSHRKVMELRRQKELLIRHQQAAAFVATGTPAGSAATAAAATRPDMLLRDYEVC